MVDETQSTASSDITYEEFLQLVAQTPTERTAQVPESGCPVSRTLTMIQGKWKTHVLFYLCKSGPSRFGAIHRAHPRVSKTMLSSVLKQLEQDGLVVRRQFDEMPPHTEYELTQAGADLMPVFYEVFRWGVNHPVG